MKKITVTIKYIVQEQLCIANGITTAPSTAKVFLKIKDGKNCYGRRDDVYVHIRQSENNNFEDDYFEMTEIEGNLGKLTNKIPYNDLVVSIEKCYREVFNQFFQLNGGRFVGTNNVFTINRDIELKISEL